MYHYGSHGNLVTIATRYVPNMPIVQKNPHTKDGLNMTLKTKELLTYHCGCHGNLAMRYVADAYHPKEPPYKIWTQYN